MVQYKTGRLNIADARALEDTIAQQSKNKADIDFIALMTDVELVVDDENMSLDDESEV